MRGALTRSRAGRAEAPAPAAARPLRVLVLSRYGALGASSRLRMYQFLPALAAAGVQATVAPLLPDEYLTALYGGRRLSPSRTVQWYAARLATLRALGDHDVVWLEKEAFPWWPFAAERLLLGRGRPVVVDYDDAWYLRYDDARRRILRRALAGKIDRVMAAADVVVAGNRHLADHATRAGARRVELVPTVLDPTRYRRGVAGERGPCTIGWIGSPGSSSVLEAVREPLAEAMAAGARLTLIGAPPDALEGLDANRRPWTESTEADEVAALDVGIMPLADAPWERGKCGYKLLQYMAAARPVIASPVGANCEIVRHGETGFLASTPEEWAAALHALARDPGLRARMGEAGRARVEREYSSALVAPRLLGILRETAARAAAARQAR